MSDRPLRDALRFLGTFARNPRSVGAVWPSSRHLAAVLAGNLRLAADDVIVEYGPGTGPITAHIAMQLPPAARYVGIERDPGFHAGLSARFPELDFHLGSVEDVEQVLDQRGWGKPKYIISGLPFASLPETLQRNVTTATCRVLRDDGEFRTFQYVHAWALPAAVRFRRQMASVFSQFERSRAVLRNVPPAYVLTYRR